MDRAVSPIISVILMVAIVVILAATISVFVLGFTEDLDDPAPNVAQSSGAFIPQDGNSGGIVKLTHVAGESVAISDVEIAVRAACEVGTRQGRIVNLPAGSYNAIRQSDGQIEGDEIFDERSLNTIDNQVDGVNNGGALLQGGQYTAGDSIIFRIAKSDCELTQGSEISVQVVHSPSQAVVIDKELIA
ncbi:MULTISPECIES: type IV pilin N-terminal domain-containing protein [Haloarcula]|uniref:type IV pilin N-terminal domain-containing protein n=1 Tax=Haloarcula TaxID=2237 RepID=UPI0023EDE014|nr:type IV pilin N-terminal domain-containing protein [Halomicroarcula sp. XH51]